MLKPRFSSRRTFLRSLVVGSLVLPAIVTELLGSDVKSGIQPGDKIGQGTPAVVFVTGGKLHGSVEAKPKARH